MATQPDSATRPDFGAGGPSDPAAYESAAWNIYDRVVNAAARNGIGMLFTVTGPGPLWASSDPSRNDKPWDPSAGDFEQFVTAVGRRYSGTYADEQPVQPPPPSGLPLPLLGPPPPPPPPPPEILPRVSMWSIWNEPNQPGWLRPQSKGQLPSSPIMYRALQDAGYAGLAASGHGDDTYLLAETAPKGAPTLGERDALRPLLFIRELYCVDAQLTPYTGQAATDRGCPADPAGFAAAHPGLFRASGFAHHPYAFEVAPSTVDPIQDQVTLAVLPRLFDTLDGIFRSYGSNHQLPVWLTEYGYQTNPPDPIDGISLKRQAAYLNQAEYMAYRQPRVRSTAQFLLVDDGPNKDWPPSHHRYWDGTFQTGLLTEQGKRKNAFAAYRLPIHLSSSRVRRGRTVRLFGANRPAAGGALPVNVEFRKRGAASWRVVRRLTTGNARGYVIVKLKARAAGAYRLAWENGRSRSVSLKLAGG